jgi:hypothetical protein
MHAGEEGRIFNLNKEVLLSNWISDELSRFEVNKAAALKKIEIE